MFKVNANPTFKRSVTVLVPSDGGHDAQELAVTFRVVDADALAAIENGDRQGLKDFCETVVVSFDNLADDDGKPIPHSDAMKAKLIGMTFVRLALFRDYLTAMTKARQGN